MLHNIYHTYTFKHFIYYRYVIHNVLLLCIFKSLNKLIFILIILWVGTIFITGNLILFTY